MRLDKYLADMNAGTRKELKNGIRKGLAVVDGTVIRDPGYALSGTEKVTYGGREIAYAAYEYYLMNKPAGVISATEDSRQKTVLDLLGEQRRKDLFPVGRLDKDTVGLLLITNDGALSHRLLAPKKHVDKIYFARVTGRVTGEAVDRFAEGVPIGEGIIARPAGLEILEAGEEYSEVRVTIHEGRFHQVKRMFLAIGHEVVYLKRLAMGPLVLDEDLEEGAYRPLTPEELQLLGVDQEEKE